jgi:hypothetical protein
MRKDVIYIAIVHTCILSIIYCFLQSVGFLDFLSNKNLVKWDSIWYSEIKMSGYHYIPDSTCNLAFFPLFPLFWRLLHVSAIQMSLINYLLFVLSFIFLASKYKINKSFIIFILSTPIYIFFYVPYSEALFFFFAVIIIHGFDKKSIWLQCLGFFGASLVRSVSVIFIPALLICFFITHHTNNYRRALQNLIINILSCILSVFITVLYQGLQTDKWFYFIQIQKYWKRQWEVPSFPLTTYSPERILGVDGIAFIVGIIALFFFIKRLNEKFSPSVNTGQYKASILFSMVCLIGITMLDTFFTFKEANATNIWSLGRHLLCTPFFLNFIFWWTSESKPSVSDLKKLAIIVILGIFITGTYAYPSQVALYIFFFTAILIVKYFDNLGKFLYIIYVLGILLQILNLKAFLSDNWVG